MSDNPATPTPIAFPQRLVASLTAQRNAALDQLAQSEANRAMLYDALVTAQTNENNAKADAAAARAEAAAAEAALTATKALADQAGRV